MSLLPTGLLVLPDVLSERCRALNSRPPADRGEFVLLWLHHAVRADENPALETAVALAAALARPLLVYQGLAGKHCYNSDRHHRFILEGARDCAAALASRGIQLHFHLPSDPTRPGPLPGLFRRATVSVVEDLSSSRSAAGAKRRSVLPMRWSGTCLRMPMCTSVSA